MPKNILFAVLFTLLLMWTISCSNDECKPTCEGRICGDDGCGETCGTCGSGESCEDGQCVTGGMLNWVVRAGGPRIDIASDIVAVSPEGSAVVTGSFWGTAVFGPGEANESNLSTPGADTDVFLAKYNPDGTLAWASHAEGPSDDGGSGIAVLSDNSIIVAGYFEDTSTFGLGEGNETTISSAGYWDMFIAKYREDGSVEWVYRGGGSDRDYARDISILQGGSFVVVGTFQGTATFGEGETNETTLVSSGDHDIFLAGFYDNGTLEYAVKAGGPDLDWARKVAVLSDGSLVVVGRFVGTSIFGIGETNETTLTSAGNSDLFIARYNPDGTLIFARRDGGVDEDDCLGVSVLSDGSFVTTGKFSGTATFGQGEISEETLTSAGDTDVFIAKYSDDGTLSWVCAAGGSGSSVFGGDSGNDITVDTNGSSIVTGSFVGRATFGLGEEKETTLTSFGEHDVFVSRYNTDGKLIWAVQAGSTNIDSGSAITLLPDGSSIVTGLFSSSAVFGTSGENEKSVTSAGESDVFVAKIGQ